MANNEQRSREGVVSLYEIQMLLLRRGDSVSIAICGSLSANQLGPDSLK